MEQSGQYNERIDLSGIGNYLLAIFSDKKGNP